MELTLKDLKDRLAKFEETYLVELLGITSSDLVEKFEELIEEKFDDLFAELEEGFDIRANEEDDDGGPNPL